FESKMATALPMLAIFGGNSVATMVNNLLQTGPDTIKVFTGPLGKVADTTYDLFFKDGGSTPGIFSYTVSYLIIEKTLSVLAFVVLIVASILAFTILAVQKLWAFFSSIFLIIHIFGENQREKVMASFSKILSIAFKSVLLVFSVFITIYSLSLLTSLENILMNDFFANMGTVYDISRVEQDGEGFTGVSDFMSWIFQPLSFLFTKYAFWGVGKLVFLVVKLYLIIYMVFQLPAYFYNLLSIEVDEKAEKLMENIQEAGLNSSLKGI
ncbi:MAG: hypothetical protein U9N59_10515, partial [Campylobacterota bacterium]|nr:hypothetical protein [Campylobacterota bacterium]